MLCSSRRWRVVLLFPMFYSRTHVACLLLLLLLRSRKPGGRKGIHAMCTHARLEGVVRSGDVAVVEVGEEGDLLQDVVLDAGDARGVEDDGKEGNTTEGARGHAAAWPETVSFLRFCCASPSGSGFDSQAGQLLGGEAGHVGLVVVSGRRMPGQLESSTVSNSLAALSATAIKRSSRRSKTVQAARPADLYSQTAHWHRYRGSNTLHSRSSSTPQAGATACFSPQQT